ncbi:MAG: metalloregulator ArsR/SmtB family transcription factor [Steroidobacteraceae bacterium]
MPNRLDRTFAALADPTRRAILARLAAGEATVSELARPFLADMSLPAVTKHLQVLERAGLVSKGRKAQWRPCRLNSEPLREAVDWMEHHRVAWEEQLDRLGAYLKSQQKGARRGHKK